jgi:queuine tRNA-ribosyltransferase
MKRTGTKQNSDNQISFRITHTQTDISQGINARCGIITTPHGQIQTPAFIPVGTSAAMKGVLPEMMHDLGAQALLANAYHLFLRPGSEVVELAGGLANFMNWNGPTFTDSGGFQVMSLGAGYKKVISMSSGGVDSGGTDLGGARTKEKLASVDEDGVSFKSHLSGEMFRFTPERSIQIQHELGADIMFAFDELTTLMNSRTYQEESVERTFRWAKRCVAKHKRLTALSEYSHVCALLAGTDAGVGVGVGTGTSTTTNAGMSTGIAADTLVCVRTAAATVADIGADTLVCAHTATHTNAQSLPALKPYQALFGVIQGANYEDLRRLAAKQIASLDFDGFGIGGALEKEILPDIIRWVVDEFEKAGSNSENKPRHLLGISEIDDLFNAVQAGIDTFDCVSPARVGRNGAVYTPNGRVNIKRAEFKCKFEPIFEGCDCYTCANYTAAYLNHLMKAKEINASTLATIHNERFIVRLVDDMRLAIEAGDFLEFKADFLGRYYGKSARK